MKRKIFTIMVIFLFFHFVIGQTNQRIIPPSPNASSLGQYGDVPVSYYSGIPEISIPIYTVKCGSITLPISLNYHASGIKVSQQASWVGLGWSLNSGGVITRTIFGYDDFGKEKGDNYGNPSGPKGYYYDQDFKYVNSENKLVEPQNNDISAIYYDYNIIASGDGEPDVFTFNFNGYTGKFYFDRKRTNTENYAVPVFSNNSNLSVKYYPSYNEDIDMHGGQSYGHWEIIDGKGYKYHFITKEITSIFTSECLNYCACNNYFYQDLRQPEVVNTWYLNRIESPNGDFINFIYNEKNHPIISNQTFNQMVVRATDIISANGCVKCNNNSIVQIVSHEVYLKEIEFNNGKIYFHTSNRTDLETKQIGASQSYNAQKLDSIKVYNKQAMLLKCVFDYGYFGSWRSNDPDYGRLKLNNLFFYDSNANESHPYKFEYIDNSSITPSKKSNAIDHWGYFNGKGNEHEWDSDSYGNIVSCQNGTLIPPTELYYGVSKILLHGADREPDDRYMSNLMLNKISYPTGGWTEFIFEPNTYSNFGSYYVDNFETVSAGIGFTNVLDDKYDMFTIDEDQEVDIRHGFVDNQITSVIPQYENDWSCYFISGLEGTYAQLFKIESNGTSTLIKEFHATAGEERIEDLSLVFENSWQFSKSEKIHLQKGNYKIQINYLQPDNGSNCHISVKYIKSKTLISEKIAGGLRIKRILNNAGKDPVIRSFDYTSGPNLSTGILLSTVPVYFAPMNIDFIYQAGFYSNSIGGESYPFYSYGNGSFLVGMSGGLQNICSANGSIVGYSKVTELISDSNIFGKSIYYFNNDREVPNVESQRLTFVSYDTGSGYTNGYNLTNSYFSLTPNVPNISPLANGLLKEKELYDKTNNIVHKEKYFYSKDVNTSTSIKGVKINKLLANSPSYNIKFYDRNCEWWKLDSIKTTKFIDSKEVCITKEYDYNTINLLHKKVTIKNSNGKTFEKQITYPCDIDDNGVYSNMTAKNMIEYPIEEREYVDGKLVKGELSTYNASYLPYEKYISEKKTPITSFSIFNGTKDSHYPLLPQIKYNKYGYNGRINEIIQKDGNIITYLWSYKNEYPIAEIKNATFSQVSSALSGITPEQLASSVVPNMDKVEALRQNSNLSNAQITTYTYKPLVGMTSVTDPRGVTTYYEYDDFNRLKQTYIIENGEKKILQKYDYHYANQQ